MQNFLFKLPKNIVNSQLGNGWIFRISPNFIFDSHCFKTTFKLCPLLIKVVLIFLIPRNGDNDTFASLTVNTSLFWIHLTDSSWKALLVFLSLKFFRSLAPSCYFLPPQPTLFPQFTSWHLVTLHSLSYKCLWLCPMLHEIVDYCSLRLPDTPNISSSQSTGIAS